MIRMIRDKSTFICFLFVMFGCFLRFYQLDHMEWKFDQAWMYYNSLEMADTGVFPWLGMRSGGGIVNPGLSLWVFILLAKLLKTPLAMVTGVAFLNILAIICFFILGLYRKSLSEKKLILNTAALWAVSPLAIVFSRNIWAQDILAPFVILFVIGAYFRKNSWCAFLWGLFGAILGQIHMPGFFYAFGFFLFLIILDYRKGSIKHYRFWLLGSLLGALLLIPWIEYLINMPKIVKAADPNNSGVIELKHIFKLRFYSYSFLEGLGIHLKYSLGKKFYDFLNLPFGMYGLGILHVLSVVLGMSGLIIFIKQYKDKGVEWNEFDYLLGASWIGGGLVLTLVGLKMHPHYIICALPFSFYFFIRALSVIHVKWTYLFIFSQLIISFGFLIFIAENGGVHGEEYGKSYQYQIENGLFDIKRDKSQFHLKMKH